MVYGPLAYVPYYCPYYVRGTTCFAYDALSESACSSSCIRLQLKADIRPRTGRDHANLLAPKPWSAIPSRSPFAPRDARMRIAHKALP